jgi:hypothetical protein
LLLAVFAHFTVVGVDQRDVIQTVGNGVCGLVSAYAGSTALYALLTRSSFMRLTAEGFEIQYARRFERHSWRDVAGFAVIPTGRGGSRVIYDDAAKTEARARTSRLVRTYGLGKRGHGAADERVAQAGPRGQPLSLRLGPPMGCGALNPPYE